MATATTSSFNNAILSRLRDFIGGAERQKSEVGDLQTGLFRIGNLGSFSGQAWYYQRIVNAVYHNPTGKRCTDAISAAFARAPLKCYRPGDEIRETVINSPLQSLLDNPVPGGLSVQAVSGKMSARKRARDLTLSGMSLSLKVRGDTLTGGPITQIRRLPPQRVTVIGNHHDELLGFIYNDRLGGRLPLLPQWCVYERFAHPDRDYQPFPPALAAGLAAETDNAAARFNLDLLANDGAIPAVVMLEGLTPDQFGEWTAAWMANEDPGKVRFMGFTGTPEGKSVEVVKIGQTNKDLAYDQLRDYSQGDIGRALGCPPVVAYQLQHETYANAETEIKLWYATTIWDYWDQSADEMTAQLGAEYNVELGYATGGIAELQESKDSMVDRLLKLQTNQNLSINDTNERLGMPKVDWGDEPLLPTAPMKGFPGQPLTEEPPPPPDGPPPPGAPAPPTPPPAKAALPRYRRQGAASLAIESQPPRETSALTTADRGAAPNRVANRLRRFYERQGRVVAKRLLSPGRDRSATALLKRDWFDAARWDEELTEELQDLGIDGAAALARQANESTRSELLTLLADRPPEGFDDTVKSYFAQKEIDL
jgi:phage portal protein BeeE